VPSRTAIRRYRCPPDQNRGLASGRSLPGYPNRRTSPDQPVGPFRPLGNIKPSILRLGFLFSLTDLRQRPRIKLEVLSMSLGAGLAVSIRTAAGAALALLVLTAPVIACRGALYHKILLDAVPPAAEGSEVIAKVEIVEVQIRELPGLRPVHASCNQSEVLQTDRSFKSMRRGPHVVADSIRARLDAGVSLPDTSTRSQMKPYLSAFGVSEEAPLRGTDDRFGSKGEVPAVSSACLLLPQQRTSRFMSTLLVRLHLTPERTPSRLRR
jgi:hypothetical protein